MKINMLIILAFVVIGGALGYVKKGFGGNNLETSCSNNFVDVCELFYLNEGHIISDRMGHTKADKDKIRKAIDFYQKAADHNSSEAYFHIGWVCHFAADAVLRTVIKPQKPNSLDEIASNDQLKEYIICAEKNYRQSADLGFAPAMINYEFLKENWGSSYKIFTYKLYRSEALSKRNPLALAKKWFQEDGEKRIKGGKGSGIVINDVYSGPVDLSRTDEKQVKKIVLHRTIYRDRFISRKYAKEIRARMKENPKSVYMAIMDAQQRYVSGHLIVGDFRDFSSFGKKLKK
jgi:TPR repeat protein